jgi:preprotein translocase subunit SecG
MHQFWTDLSSIVFAIAGVCLMSLVLLQRGRGAGLVGAFGKGGGQSAFGTKAGDVFTRMTLGVAVVWIVMAAITGLAIRSEIGSRF